MQAPNLVYIYKCMLQFNTSIPINSNAVYADAELTSSLPNNRIVLEFTQSYDLSVTSSVTGYLLNAPGVNGNNFIVFQVSASTLPTASGQYIVNTYASLDSDGANYTWGAATFTWTNDPDTWGASAAGKSTFLSADRAYLSGSNEVEIIQYTSPNEYGAYTTYNG